MTKQAIESIARNLRNLRCDNSLVAMNLHRVARDLEAIVAGHATPEVASSIRAAELVRLEAGPFASPTIWSAQERGE